MKKLRLSTIIDVLFRLYGMRFSESSIKLFLLAAIVMLPQSLSAFEEYYFFQDEDGINGIIQCEINIETGERLTPGKRIWSGSGGRYIESPHMYKINGYYYLLAAEGGTEYGHMVTYSRSASVWGPFEGYRKNPVLTNRNKAPYIIQGIGHGDLIQAQDGSWFILSLGFRQIHLWQPYHHLGREIFLTPVQFDQEGWFTAGTDGTTDAQYQIAGGDTVIQEYKNLYTFENTDWNIDWCYMRRMRPEHYALSESSAILTGSEISLEDVDSPTFIGIRQLDFNMELQCDVKLSTELSKNSDLHPAAGITVFMCEHEHYDILLRPSMTSSDASLKNPDANPGYETVLRLNIGDIKHEQAVLPLTHDTCTFIIRSDSLTYHFYVRTKQEEYHLGSAESKYLSSEVSSGFTGVILGLFAEGACNGEFTGFKCEYT